MKCMTVWQLGIYLILVRYLQLCRIQNQAPVNTVVNLKVPLKQGLCGACKWLIGFSINTILSRIKLKLCTHCTILAAHIYESFWTNLRQKYDTFYCILLSTSSTQRSTENIQRIKITSVPFCKSAFTFITWILRWTFFFVIKPTRCTNFINLFCYETLCVSDSSSVRHQEFICCTLSNGICHTSL